MIKLLILADDLTGALDTGIQFAKWANTRVILDAEYSIADAAEDVEVLVIDTESRHVSPERSREIVSHIVRQAAVCGIPYLYKKTDSALRGNTGAEVTAALEASGEKQLHFIPAFPKLKRTTVEGVQLIDGVPVKDSVFGADPFNPVLHSSVADIIHEQSEATVREVSIGEEIPEEEGIFVYDAVTDEDIKSWTKALSTKGKLRVLAGCAGFASALPELLGLSGGSGAKEVESTALLVACGSVNPITVAQMEAAEKLGVRQQRLTARQALMPGEFSKPEGQALLDDIASCLKAGNHFIINTNPAPGMETTKEFAGREGMDIEEVRVRVSDNVGVVLKELLDRDVHAAMMVTGVDTIMAFLRTVGVSEIAPVRELVTGTVLSLVEIDGTAYNIVSKSGGFGEEQVVAQVLEQMGFEV